MAAINVTQPIELIPGLQPIDCKIGSIGRGKGGSKIRLVPAVKDENILLAIARTLPGWSTLILPHIIGQIFSQHSPACISGVPEKDLTVESLKAALDANEVSFDIEAFNESIASEYADARAGRVSAESKLTKWSEDNTEELTSLYKLILDANMQGNTADPDVISRVQALTVEQGELVAAVAAEQARKEERKAKRSSNKPVVTSA